MRVALGTDHAGYRLKEEIKRFLEELGHQHKDFGAFDDQPSDYPDYAIPVAQAVAQGQFDRGILFCGNGVGMEIVANKVKGIRATVASDSYTARTSREDDDTNVLALGERVVGPELAKEIVRVWLTTEFSGQERHHRRLKKIADLEEEPGGRPQP